MIRTSERRQLRYLAPFSSVSIVEFKQVNVSWVGACESQIFHIFLIPRISLTFYDPGEY